MKNISAAAALAALLSVSGMPGASAATPVTIPGTSVNMNQNPFTAHGWTATSAYWSWGIPTGLAGEPLAAHTGTHVVGFNIGGRYPNYLPATYVTTGPLDCSEYVNVQLQFWRWLRVENSIWDTAAIQVSSNNGATWHTIWMNDLYTIHLDYQWTQCTYDVSAYADGRSQFRVRWQMGPTDFIYNYAGWYIDDFSLLGVKAEWIAFSPTSLSTTVLQGENPAESPTFEVWSGTGQTLSFQVTANTPGWPAGTGVTFTPSSGTSSGVGQKRTITVNCTTAGFADTGTYTASIVVRNTANNVTRTIPLTVIVTTPVVAASPPAIVQYGRLGFNPANTNTVNVWNSGAGTLQFKTEVEYLTDWGSGGDGITVTPSTGSSTGTNDLAELVVSYESAGLPEGEHLARITISDNGSAPAAPNEVTIDVKLVVTVPVIASSTDAIVEQCLPGGTPTSRTFEIWNASVGEMVYEIDCDEAWFTCENAEGGSTGTVYGANRTTLTVTFPGADSLASPGKYEGTITISDPAAAEPRTIAVVLYVDDDTDGDGLVDLFETDYLGTDPNAWDTNGDGLSDGFKYEHGLDPLGWDTDGDGFSDAEEIAAGTDPLNPKSHPLMAFSAKNASCGATGVAGALGASLLAAFFLLRSRLKVSR